MDMGLLVNFFTVLASLCTFAMIDLAGLIISFMTGPRTPRSLHAAHVNAWGELPRSAGMPC